MHAFNTNLPVIWKSCWYHNSSATRSAGGSGTRTESLGRWRFVFLWSGKISLCN